LFSLSEVLEKLLVFFKEEFLKSEGLFDDLRLFSLETNRKSWFFSMNFETRVCCEKGLFSLGFRVLLNKTLSNSLSAIIKNGVSNDFI